MTLATATCAEILTQEQADSVRKYLVDKHAIQSAGWFKTRKVAAVGFGTHVPRTLDPARQRTVTPHRDHPVHAPDLDIRAVARSRMRLTEVSPRRSGHG